MITRVSHKECQPSLAALGLGGEAEAEFRAASEAGKAVALRGKSVLKSRQQHM
jgi:hypothetical protein